MQKDNHTNDLSQNKMGIMPENNGEVIRLGIPPLTEERRRELTKVVKHIGEEAKVAIRNLRRDANEHVKRLLKDKEISEDDQKRSEKDIQKLTDNFIAQVDTTVANKEKEVMTI